MAWNCIRAESFEKAYADLSPEQKRAAKKVYDEIFRRDPFDSRLKPHKIHKLSARYKKTIFSAKVGDNLRVVYYKLGPNEVVSVDIGTHDIYK